jgi:transglutaminase-like putative cysteine protease
MNRREFLRTGVAISTAAAWPCANAAKPSGAISTGHGWRTFEVVSRIEIADAAGVTRAWLPLPSVEEPVWVRNQGNLWSGNVAVAKFMHDETYGAAFLYAEWKDETAPVLEVTSRFSARDRAIDLSAPSNARELDRKSRKLYTAPTALIPTDGIVRATAMKITEGAGTDTGKARAIYEWVVENTFRDPKVRGCGLGDIRFMLESGDLGGKCADLNALYVGLCRAAGLPARDVYGVRVADSKAGYRSLGRSGDVSKAQHCRAEVWLGEFGWVPVDPADVRKVVLEEKPGLTLDDPLAQEVRAKLFGAWEMNWMPYNVAHDVALPGSAGPRLPFLMYPQGETGGRRLDSLAPENFRYTLTAREISA